MSESLTSLKKIKDPIFRGQEHSIKERTKELKGYREEKLQLVKQIKQLGRIFFRLKEGKKMAEKAAGEITTERLKTLEYLAREVSSELEADAGKLRKKSKKLDKRDVFLQGLFVYLSELMKIAEDTRLSSEQKAVKLDSKLGRVLKEKKRLLELKREAQELKEKAHLDSREINDRFLAIDKITRWFESEASKEKSRLEIWAGTLGIREKKVRAGKRGIKQFEEELDKREKWLDDREQTMSRTMSEIKKLQSDII